MEEEDKRSNSKVDNMHLVLFLCQLRNRLIYEIHEVYVEFYVLIEMSVRVFCVQLSKGRLQFCSFV